MFFKEGKDSCCMKQACFSQQAPAKASEFLHQLDGVPAQPFVGPESVFVNKSMAGRRWLKLTGLPCFPTCVNEQD
jgi:hypothetical protein